MIDIEAKRNDEKKVITKMIKLYCKGNKHSNSELCKDCEELLAYAILRTDKCPFMETKSFCNNCKVHCYKPEMREKISKVMKYSGQRMIFTNPILTVRHMHSTFKAKRANPS